jgi:DNA-directed RNA polymerase specialized sigma subunit
VGFILAMRNFRKYDVVNKKFLTAHNNRVSGELNHYLRDNTELLSVAGNTMSI